MKKNQNYVKSIGRMSAEKMAYLNKVFDMVEKEERNAPSKNDGFTCFIQDASQIDFLKMIMPDGTNFKVVR